MCLFSHNLKDCADIPGMSVDMQTVFEMCINVLALQAVMVAVDLLYFLTHLSCSLCFCALVVVKMCCNVFLCLCVVPAEDRSSWTFLSTARSPFFKGRARDFMFNFESTYIMSVSY